MPYDALLVVSFGGPEGPGDVIPFLENVLRGRNVPRERMLEVAQHYHHFGGKSPINDQCRALVQAIEADLAAHGLRLPVYWGNRHWHPFLTDTVRRMAVGGLRRALAFVTSAFGSYSGCRQYREDIDRARAQVGPAPPEIDKLRPFHNRPAFIEAQIDRCREAIRQAPTAELVFTAHSIPLAMTQGSPYVEQLRETCGLVAAGLGCDRWRLVYQSRSGPPSQPWLGPDIADWLREAAASGVREVVVVPIGFLSDHMEVLYDLDHEARCVADGLGIRMVRAATVGVHPRFIAMIRELILECVAGKRPEACPPECCPAPNRTAGSLPRG